MGLNKIRLFFAAFTRLTQKLKWLGAYMIIVGIVTFPLFIHEEAIQTVMFGTWSAGAADRYDIVLKGAETIDRINSSMKIINYLFGWINPLSFIAYSAYGTSADYYVEATKVKVMAKAPFLMNGQTIDTNFKIKRIERLNENQWIVSDNNLSIIVDYQPEIGEMIDASGTIQLIDGRLVIK